MRLLGGLLVVFGLLAIAMGILNGPDLPQHAEREVDSTPATLESVFSLFKLVPVIVGLILGGIGVMIVLGT